MRVLKKRGIFPRRAARKLFLSTAHANLRLEFALTFAERPAEFWEHVVFSDEKTFGYSTNIILQCVINNNISHLRSYECGRVFVYRTNGTRFDPNHVQITDRSGRKTVPVWAWFSASGPGDFVRIHGKLTAEKYLAILGDTLLPSLHIRFPGIRVNFIQDKSPIHGANVVKNWFANTPNIELLPWPAKGADMNPIENVWGDMVKDSEFFRPRTDDEVFEKVLSIWEGYRGNHNYWRKLALSMINRLRLVIENEGNWTRY